ncbi:MAG: lipopolysaccharide transport periplasmic protein LptA [Gallionella sp.]
MLAILFMLSTPCMAERADRDQPIQLEADQVTIDDIGQTSTFVGNVRLTQGTMQLVGDKIEVLRQADGFKLVKIHGNTVSFRQKREGLNEFIEGFGERIEYDTRNATVDFYGLARVKRSLDEVRGDHITYSMKTETFQVSGAPASSDAPAQRVRAVLLPKAENNEPSPSSPVKLPIESEKSPATKQPK